MVVSPHVYKNAAYNTLRDFVPVAYAGAQPLVLVVNPKLPAKSVAELVALAKSRPGELNGASAGSGSTLHLGQVLFENATGVKFTHVPYSGAPQAALAVVSGDAHVHFGSLAAVLELVRSGKLRGLAVTGPTRITALPDLPTLSAAGVPNYELIIWNALFVPKGTSPDVITKLQSEVDRAMDTKEVRESFGRLSMDYARMTRSQLDALVVSEWTRMGKVVADAGVKID